MTGLRAFAVSVAALSLTACGSGTSATPAPSPSPSPSVVVTPSASASPTPAPSVTASAAPALIRFAGDGLNVSTKNISTALTKTSPEFQAFIAKQLKELWSGAGSVAGCQGSALIVLTAYRSDGFASASDEGMFGSDTCAAGGNAAIYATVNGAWKEILGTQSGYACADLTKFKVPAAIAGSSCLDSSGNPHTYTG